MMMMMMMSPTFFCYYFLHSAMHRLPDLYRPWWHSEVAGSPTVITPPAVAPSKRQKSKGTRSMYTCHHIKKTKIFVLSVHVWTCPEITLARPSWQLSEGAFYYELKYTLFVYVCLYPPFAALPLQTHSFERKLQYKLHAGFQERPTTQLARVHTIIYRQQMSSRLKRFSKRTPRENRSATFSTR